jgi:hypothetical protein
MSLFSYGFILTLLVQFAFAAHVIRSGRSYLWILAIILLPWVGCAAYLIFAVLPDAATSAPARKLADNVVNTVDPGRGYREKKRQVELVGSVQAKRELANECIKRGYFQDAIDLYQSALSGGFETDSALLHGLARAKLLAGDGAGAQAAYERLKAADPAIRESAAEISGRGGTLPLRAIVAAARAKRTGAARIPGDSGLGAWCAVLLPKPPARMVPPRTPEFGRMSGATRRLSPCR